MSTPENVTFVMYQEYKAHLDRQTARRHASILGGFILLLRQQHQEKHNFRRIFATKYKFNNETFFDATRLLQFEHDHFGSRE